MEKYRKWDDPSNGLNPFTPLKPKKTLDGLWKIARTLITAFFLILRIPCLLLVVPVYTFLHVTKYLLVVPILIRAAERFIDFMCCKMSLNVSSVNNLKESYHREDDNFDFVKW